VEKMIFGHFAMEATTQWWAQTGKNPDFLKSRKRLRRASG
jgi:hypothetical protein